MTLRVLCVGELILDVVAQLPGELTRGSDSPAPVSLVGGGSAANTAAWLVAAGAPAALIARVGDDALGRMLVGELGASGVHVAASVDPVRPSGTCIVLVDASGERTMIPSMGANIELGCAPLPELLFPDSHVHISAYAVFAAGSRSAADEAVRLATEHGCGVSIDAASAAPLRAFGAGAFLDWLPRCVLFANRDEARVLSGLDDPAEAAAALAARCGEAIVKCGAEGAVWSDGSAVRGEVAGASRVVDSTGAGDAFAAGVLAARLGGSGISDALRAGNELAARVLTVVGGRPPAAGREVRYRR